MLNLLNENEYLAALATYDRVTGLPNRNFVEDRLAQVLASGQRHGNPFAILLIDINHFKQINDTFGHTVGDKALRAFSRELAQALRLSDTIGRYGGDEFLVIVERDVITPDALRLAHEPQADCARYRVFKRGRLWLNDGSSYQSMTSGRQ